MDFKEEISKILAPHVDMNAQDIHGMLEVPPQKEMGDFALPCFRFAKALRKAPPLIAKELAEKLECEWLERVDAVGAYINFFIRPEIWAGNVVSRVLDRGAAYGGSDMGTGKTVCMDYSSINIAKPFHIGHLCSTAIGHSLYRIYGHLGYKCVGINHLGDYGTQFGKLIVAFELWGDRDTIQTGGVSEMLKLYVRFHDEAERDESLNDRAREAFKKIEQGDEQANELFEWFKDLTIKEVQQVYDILDITFDSYAGESFYNDKMQRVVDGLNEKGLLTESDGAYVVDLEEYKMPPCLILKQDGATLYATRDIAAALYRKDTYDFYKCLYIVAYQQNLHFAQWFKVVELMGYEWSKDLEHVAFGMVSMEDGTLSTRKGKVVLLKDVLDKAIEKTDTLMQEKSPDLENREDIARQVGVGAVVFDILSNSRIKDVVFSWERVLNFDGETGPYVQYTNARCNSVLRKAAEQGAKAKVHPELLTDELSQSVIRLLYDFEHCVLIACRQNEPAVIARNIVDLAQSYNHFYYEQRIITDDAPLTAARLALTQAVQIALKTGLYLLGVRAPERM